MKNVVWSMNEKRCVNPSEKSYTIFSAKMLLEKLMTYLLEAYCRLIHDLEINFDIAALVFVCNV